MAPGCCLPPVPLSLTPQEFVDIIRLAAHVEAVCRSVSLGLIVYNRGLCRLNPAALEQLAERCPEPGRLQGRTRGHRADGETECLQTLITAQGPQ
jgi:hypothetical protein